MVLRCMRNIIPGGSDGREVGTNTMQNKLHTGWCILSRTTAFPHMVRQGDAPVYYLHVILPIWNILTRTTEVMIMNKLGKVCDVM